MQNVIELSELPIPSEPVGAKMVFRRYFAIDPVVGDGLVRQSSWLSVLWTDAGWKVPLQQRDMTWQRFLKVAHWLYKPFVQWAKNEITWQSAVNIFRDELIRLEGYQQ